MTDVELLTNLLFSETKDTDDAVAIANVVKNRLARPKRFGSTLQEVIYSPKQFSGVNTPEWNKAVKRDFTPKERAIYSKLQGVAMGVLSGALKDSTAGADHYYNPKIASPKWGEIYKETYKTKSHRYLKEK